MATETDGAAAAGTAKAEGEEDAQGNEGAAGADEWQLDLERFIEPRKAARMISSTQPIAHDGKAGWAVERGTQRAVWIGGETQFDVLMRRPGAPRDEPGLTDIPAHGGLPEPAPPEESIRQHVAEASRRRVQIGLKLSLDDARLLEEAAELFGTKRTTLARLLIVRGAREIVARARDSEA